MSRQVRISIAVSIILHFLFLLIFAGVKLYTYKSIEDSVPVNLFNNKKTIPLRRSFPVRTAILPDKSPLSYSPGQYITRPEYKPSEVFYVSIPEKVTTGVRDFRWEVFHDTGIQRPEVKTKERFSSPIATELLKNPHIRGPQIQTRISEGHELLQNFTPARAEPGTAIVDDILRRFAGAVRKKIESKKKYPVAAQSAGIEGRTRVKMTILKDGRLEKVVILKTSGYDILDSVALQSVHDAAPFPPIPEAIGQDKIEMSIYLVFKISAP